MAPVNYEFGKKEDFDFIMELIDLCKVHNLTGSIGPNTGPLTRLFVILIINCIVRKLSGFRL